MTISVKRVYEPASASDGVRVLVDRLWPRGLTKEQAAVKFWLRDVAPSNELRQWFHANPEAWPMFRRRYMKELTSPKATAAIEKLHKMAHQKKVTLLYASRNEEHNNASVLKDLLDGGRKPPSSVGTGAVGRERIRKAKRQ
jgi:uncharacterized protein YeaO (DUF488 family)